MYNIRNLKAWKDLSRLGYEVVTYRFCNVITGYGAMQKSKNGQLLIDIMPHRGERDHRWSVWMDKQLINNYGHFTLNIAYCASNKILQTISDLEAGKIEIATEYVEGKGRVAKLSGYWPPKEECPF